jgi:hypothetical protein
MLGQEAADASGTWIGALSGGSAAAALAIYALRLVWNRLQAALEALNQCQQARLDDMKETAAMLATTAKLIERATTTLERVSSSNQVDGR